MKAEEVDDFQPMSVKEALTILSSLQASQVLRTLKHNDFAMLAGLAFQGFRMDAGGYTNPIVRRRLAEEAGKNHAFAIRLRELAIEPPPPMQLSVPAQKLTTEISRPAEPARELEKYRAERERLKHERDAALAAKLGAERQLTETKRELIAATTAKTEADREIERLKQRVERIERKQRQLETTNAALRRAAIQPPPALAVQHVPELARAVADERHFAEAIRHLLAKDRGNVALSLVNDVLRATPDDVDALEIKAEALIRMENIRESVPVLRSVASLHLKHNALLRCASALYKLLILSQSPVQESKIVREFMHALSHAHGSPAKLAEPLCALRIDSPVAFNFVRSLTPPAMLQILFPEQMTFAPDAALPLFLAAGLVVTARRLVTGIERNDQAVIELAQEALKNKETDERDKILSSVTRAAEGESTYAHVLAPKFSRGAVIVDSSNVAWHGQEMLAQQQPRMEFILAIRKALWNRGYFPVLLVADANLPYVISDQPLARRMVEEEQIQLVIGGSDADEQILREAQRLRAPVVTNDYMSDWDPEQKVIKIQYSFTPDGKPTLYW